MNFHDYYNGKVQEIIRFAKTSSAQGCPPKLGSFNRGGEDGTFINSMGETE